MPKILIADDSELILRQLSSTLSEVENWSVCGQAANGRQAVLMAHQLKPDVIILDLTMPMLDGLSATAEILKNSPAVPIILYTLHKNDQVQQDAIRVGARKVVSKSSSVDSLVEAIRQALVPTSTAVAFPLGGTGSTLEHPEQTKMTLEASTPKSSEAIPQSGEGI